MTSQYNQIKQEGIGFCTKFYCMQLKANKCCRFCLNHKCVTRCLNVPEKCNCGCKDRIPKTQLSVIGE